MGYEFNCSLHATLGKEGSGKESRMVIVVVEIFFKLKL